MRRSPNNKCSALPLELLSRILASNSQELDNLAALRTVSHAFAEALKASPLHITIRDVRRALSPSSSAPTSDDAKAAKALPQGCKSYPPPRGSGVTLKRDWASMVSGLARHFPRAVSVNLQTCNVDHRGVSHLVLSLPQLQCLAVSKCFGVQGDVLFDRLDAAAADDEEEALTTTADDAAECARTMVPWSRRARVLLLGDLPMLHATVAIPRLDCLVSLGLTNCNLSGSPGGQLAGLMNYQAQGLPAPRSAQELLEVVPLPFICKLAEAITGERRCFVADGVADEDGFITVTYKKKRRHDDAEEGDDNANDDDGALRNGRGLATALEAAANAGQASLKQPVDGANEEPEEAEEGGGDDTRAWPR